jgi:hypothetical protein
MNTKRKLNDDHHIILGLTYAAVRLIGSDKREDLIDEAAEGLEGVIDGLERFGSIADCNTGAEYTIVALRQIIGWMRKRDYDAASNALREREIKDGRYHQSMFRAAREQGIIL